MDVAVTGSSGLIGSALVASLEADGHRVVRVVRRRGQPATVSWDPAAGEIDAAGLEGLDAVVHLAGEGIASGPWTAARKRRIHDSRSEGTALLARTLAALDRPPAVLVSASGMNYYGDRGDDVLDEGEPPGDDFLARVCTDWEAATVPASDAGIRVATVRTGLVLAADGGALPKLLLAFRAGLGGRVGSGRQWVSWLTLDDHVALLRHAIDQPAVRGAVNAGSPSPVRNSELTEVLGAVLRRPTFVPLPAFVRHLPLGVGDLVEALLLTSVRMRPSVLESTGFEFSHPELRPALESVLGR